MSDKTPKTVPPRNNLKREIPVVRNRPDLEGLDQNFRYERFSLDPRHPSFVEKKLNERVIGDDFIGYKQVPDGEGWEVVHRETDPRVKQLGIRDDQGKSLDGTVRHGNTILCRMPLDTWKETYQWADRSRQDLDAKRIEQGDSESYGPHRLRARAVSDEAADVNEILGVK